MVRLTGGLLEDITVPAAPGNARLRGGGAFWMRPTHQTTDPPTQLWTHPDPPTTTIFILWGAFL